MKGFLKKALGIILLISISTTSFAETPAAKTKDFINMMVKEQHFNRGKLTKLFSSLKPNQSILDKINSPYEAKPWASYRKHFITQKRINAGVNFWKENKKTLQQAEERYGVPANVIVAIIGIETNYGQYHGTFQVLDSLNTLSFYYPRREKFFKRELKEFLLLSREYNIPPTQLKGSYAGAIGIPQFMPSTYRHYAVAENKSLKPDLSGNTKDAIFSVANYLAKAGWKRNQLITEQVSSKKPVAEKWISSNPRPKQSCKNLIKSAALKADKTQQKCALIALDFKNEAQYWLTFNNFSSIMRYNPRIPYAMAVYQLSQAIQHSEKRA